MRKSQTPKTVNKTVKKVVATKSTRKYSIKNHVINDLRANITVTKPATITFNGHTIKLGKHGVTIL